MLVVRDEQVLSSEEAGAVREGDHLYLLAPPEKAQALDRFFVDMPPPAAPDPRLLGDFFVPATATLGALAEIYGIDVAPEQNRLDFFVMSLPPSSVTGYTPAIACRSAPLRWWPTRSLMGKSPTSDCDWQNPMRPKRALRRVAGYCWTCGGGSFVRCGSQKRSPIAGAFHHD